MLWHFTCFVNIKSRNIKRIVLVLPVVAVAHGGSHPGADAAEAKPVEGYQGTNIP